MLRTGPGADQAGLEPVSLAVPSDSFEGQGVKEEKQLLTVSHTGQAPQHQL